MIPFVFVVIRSQKFCKHPHKQFLQVTQEPHQITEGNERVSTPNTTVGLCCFLALCSSRGVLLTASTHHFIACPYPPPGKSPPFLPHPTFKLMQNQPFQETSQTVSTPVSAYSFLSPCPPPSIYGYNTFHTLLSSLPISYFHSRAPSPCEGLWEEAISNSVLKGSRRRVRSDWSLTFTDPC